MVVFTEIYFAFFNGFSGQIYFPDWLPMLYNSLWTSWPCLFTFALDRVNLLFICDPITNRTSLGC